MNVPKINTSVSLVLASASPRRKELLEQAGVKFRVIPPGLVEPDHRFGRLLPAQRAEAIAYFKARAVADLYPDDFVMGADTIVAVGKRVLGKPADANEAREMLRFLSGTQQVVITGVALLGPGGYRLIASDETAVTMRAMSEQDIEDYIASGEWMDKAGAYAIQETADRFVSKIDGSWSNVVGLPLELLSQMLQEMGSHLEIPEAS